MAATARHREASGPKEGRERVEASEDKAGF